MERLIPSCVLRYCHLITLLLCFFLLLLLSLLSLFTISPPDSSYFYRNVDLKYKEEEESFAGFIHVDRETEEWVPTKNRVLSVDRLPQPFKQDAFGEYVSLLNKGHPTYMTNYRNPCWREELKEDYPYKGDYFYQNINPRPYNEDIFKQLSLVWQKRIQNGVRWRTRCLPYFYIIGFPKCGSTDLFRVVSQHPLIEETSKKEFHWWAITRIASFKDQKNYEEAIERNETYKVKEGYASPIRFYVDVFDKASLEIEGGKTIPDTSKKAEAEIHDKIIGDGSPDTIWNNVLWEQTPENQNQTYMNAPKYIAAHYIHEVTPQAKLVVIMRNPVDRLYSWYNFKIGRSPEEFHNMSKVAIRRFKSCLQVNTEWGCVNNVTVDGFFRLRVSIYVPFIREWLKVFPREQFYFTRLEDFGLNRLREANNVANFLQIGPIPPEQRSNIIANLMEHHEKKRNQRNEPMFNKTRDMLSDFFRPYNDQLAELMANKKFRFY